MLGYLPLYIAREAYDFEMLNTGNDDSAINAVVEGRADISVGDPFMFNHVDYKRIRVVSGFINRPFVWLITFNPFLKDLKNKTLVTAPNPSTTYHFALKLQKKHNLKLLEMPFNTELGPLLTQEADIALVNEPAHTQAIMNGGTEIKSFFKEKLAFTGFCAEKYNPKLFKELQKGIDIFYKDKKTTLDVAKKYFSFKENMLINTIDNLRMSEMYSLNFTKKEIENAMVLKGLKVNRFEKFIKIEV